MVLSPSFNDYKSSHLCLIISTFLFPLNYFKQSHDYEILLNIEPVITFLFFFDSYWELIVDI